MANLHKIEERIIRTAKEMIDIYDKYRNDFLKVHGIELSYPEISQKIAQKIALKGGVFVS